MSFFTFLRHNFIKIQQNPTNFVTVFDIFTFFKEKNIHRFVNTGIFAF